MRYRLIETEPSGRLARLGLDFPDLHALNPRLVHVSLTPFGRQGPRAHWQTSDLVAAALGGVLSVTGTPDAPLNGWGRQCFNTASFFTAICGLAGVYAARETGHGQHIDLSLHQSVISCTEQVLMFWFFHKMFPVAIAPRQASLHWTGAFKVAPCASGQVMVTPGAHMPVLVDWLDADGMAGDLKELDLTDTLKVFAHIPHIMELLQAWVATKDAHELFLAAQHQPRHEASQGHRNLPSPGRAEGNQDAFADHVPNNVYRCLNDEWLAITTRDEQEWRRLCEAIGAQELANDSRLTLLEGRLVHQSEVDEAIGKWAARQDAEQAMRQLQAVGVPAGKVQNARDLTERDEQLAARRWLLEVDHKLLGRHQLDRFPATFGDASLEPYRPAPFFGEHNFEVYRELLGMSEEEIVEAIGEGLFA